MEWNFVNELINVSLTSKTMYSSLLTFRPAPGARNFPYAPVTSHSRAPCGLSWAVQRLLWTKIIRPHSGPVRRHTNLVCTGPVEFKGAVTPFRAGFTGFLRAWIFHARYGRVNSMVNAKELRARCEGTWTYKNERFFPISGNNITVLGSQNDFKYCKKTL